MGMVFVLDDREQFEQWLQIVLSQVRHVKGIVQKLIDNCECPGMVGGFKHSTTKADEVPCEASLINALSKVGVMKK